MPPTHATNLEAIVTPLAEACERLRFVYSWRVQRSGEDWVATVRAGFPDVAGRPYGPRPCYQVRASSPSAALTRAVDFAMLVVRQYPHGFSPPEVR